MKKLVTVGSFGAKIAIVITATVGGTALVGSSVFASLTATANNGTAQSVTSGTLKLTQAASGLAGQTAGFSSTFPITGLAPTDTTTRFLDLSNTGTISGASMTLGLADSTGGSLTTGTSAAANGLQIAVSECTLAYAAGLCTGTGAVESSVISTSANALLIAKTLTVTPADLAVGGVTHLKFVISLPASNEVTTNGNLPGTTGGTTQTAPTIQGVTALLTLTFTETQRLLTNTVA